METVNLNLVLEIIEKLYGTGAVMEFIDELGKQEIIYDSRE